MAQVGAAHFSRIVSRLVPPVAPVRRTLVVVTAALLCGHVFTSAYAAADTAAADTATQSLPRPALQYPPLSKTLGESGRVIVRVKISTEGTVTAASVHRSSGFERLDEAARQAALTMRFAPYKENGKPRRAIADLPFDFRLETPHTQR